jgi:hypothetical protein
VERRKDELVRRGRGWRTSSGEFQARANVIETLRGQEVERIGRQLASDMSGALPSIPFRKTRLSAASCSVPCSSQAGGSR